MKHTLGADANSVNLIDFGLHKANAAAHEVCDMLDAFEEAQDALRRSRTPETKAGYAQANADLQNARRRRREAKEASLRVDCGG